MRAVGSSRRPRLVAVGSRTSTQVTGASYSDSTVSSFASPDVNLASRAVVGLARWIELTYSRQRALSRPARWERS
jgi:hypothetical protein